VADLVQVGEFSAGDVIFSQGDSADAFYVIDTGQVIETAEGAPTGRQTYPKFFAAGSFFGRYSLSHGTKRRATARAATDVRLFRFNPDVFHYLRQSERAFDESLERFDMLKLLRQETLFSRLSEDELKYLAGYVGLAHFPKGSTVFYQGEVDPTFYMLYEGEAVLRHRDEQGRDRPTDVLRAGMGTGETGLFFQGPNQASLKTTTASNWLYLSRSDLDEYLAQRPEVKEKLLPSGSLTPEMLDKPFDWLDLDEQVLLQRRRHWFALMGKVLSWRAVVFAVGLAFLVLGWRATGIPLFGWLTLVTLMVAGAWLLWTVVDWLNDYFVVTTKRVVHREKVLLIREERFETPLDKVQNVNIDRRLIGNLLGYGNLVIDTAAAFVAERVMFNFLVDPEGAKTLIFDAMAQVRDGERPEETREMREKLQASLGSRVQPTVPKQVVPSGTVLRSAVNRGPLGRAYDATLGRMFWIESTTEGQVIWRKHWLRLLQRVAAPTVLAILVIVAYTLLFSPSLLGIGGLVAVLAVIGFWWWWGWQDWGNDQYIVTNDRIIDTEKKPLRIRSERTEAPFDRIQNVSMEIPHFIANLLNYGTVSIHTAGAVGQLDFVYVSKPRHVQAEIFRRLAAHEEAQRRQQRELVDLPAWFSAYERTRNP